MNIHTIAMIGMPGITELLIIAGVLVLLFGGKKIGEMGKGLAVAIRDFRSAVKPLKDEIDSVKKDLM